MALIAFFGAGVLAITWGQAALAIIGGSLAGALVSALIGPFVAQRAARIETFRSWQAELAGEFLKKLAEVRGALGELGLHAGDNARETKTRGLIEDLNVLALRVELVFRERKGQGAPDAAEKVVKEANDALADPLADPNLDLLDTARNTFVARASDEIRGR